MKGEEFNPGQPLRKEDFDHLRDSLSEAIRERAADKVTPGVFTDSQHSGESIPFEVTPGTTALTIHVGSGTAQGGHDSVTDQPEEIDATDGSKHAGERIVIPAADTTLIGANNYQNSPGAGPGTGTGTGPFHESADGLGGFTATPESTKTRDIPLTGNVKNWVWIGYVQRILFGPSDTTLHKITSEILYPFAEDGYRIIVNTSATPPFPDMTLLAIADLTGLPAGPITAGLIDSSFRVFAEIRVNRVSVRLDATLAPTSVTDPSTITLEEFINAVGSGTRTVNNIWGLTLADLGFTEDIDLLNHRRQHHTNGLILSSEATITSGLFPATSTSTPVGGDSGAVFLKQLSGGSESLLMNGTVFTEVLPKLISPIGGFATGDVFASFGASDAAGVYGIVVKQVGNDATMEKRVSPFSFDPTAEYLVGTAEWDGAAFINPGPPGMQTDDRKFGSVSNKDLQVDAVESDNILDDAVITAKILDLNVTNAKIADLAVNTAKLDTDAVTTAKILDANVTTAKILDLNVTTLKIADLNVTTAKMADDSVVSQKLPGADGTTAQDINTGSGVKTGHLQDGAITSAKLDASLQAQILPGNSVSGKLVVTTPSLSTVDIDADLLSINGVIVSSFNETADITVSGANGLDSGSEASGTWYAVHAITNATGSSTAALLSTSASSPTLPGGFTLFRRVGWVRNDGSSDFIEFTKIDHDVMYHDPNTLGTVAPAGTTSFATFFPPTSEHVKFTGNSNATASVAPGSGTTCTVSMRTTSSFAFLVILDGSGISGGNGADCRAANDFPFRLTSSQAADVLSGITGGGGGTYTLFARGYLDDA